MSTNVVPLNFVPAGFPAGVLLQHLSQPCIASQSCAELMVLHRMFLSCPYAAHQSSTPLIVMQDPTEVLDEYGADALRLYLINSPVVRGETLRFKKEGVFAVVKDVFLPWYNAYRFLVQNVLRLQQQTGIAFEPTKVWLQVMPCLLSMQICIWMCMLEQAYKHV